ncbi:MAG: hypothetical protein H6712_02340 [Myxococcales bacterium]|nr:hypothetical protein [Myxococcales bacterium]MCB9712667.1 hypothetical protein [Myxococcales bacterium]
MIRRLAVIASLVVLYAGCYADTDAFVPAEAKQFCKRLERCNEGQFQDRYDGDRGRCRSSREDDLFQIEDALIAGGWEYDQDAGQDCIAAYKDNRSDCSSDADREISDACADVLWDGL